jgi:hypothetical protein
MRLLNVHTFKFQQFFKEEDVAPYVVASHRWASPTSTVPAEASLEDIRDGMNIHTSGYQKVQGFVEYTKYHIPHIYWLWIDTCCIHQRASQDVTYAVTSMFRWYRRAEVCLAYLLDIEQPNEGFAHSEWFQRGFVFLTDLYSSPG